MIDIETVSAPFADQGAGSVHHIAFAVENRARQLEVREALLDTGYKVTPVIDRDYFWSIYFRTPGGRVVRDLPPTSRGSMWTRIRPIWARR